jgi:hypothetical protein
MAYKLIDTKVDYHRIYHPVHPNENKNMSKHSRISILTLNETIVDKSK